MNCNLNADPDRGCLSRCAFFFDGKIVTTVLSYVMHLSGVQYSLCSIIALLRKNNRFLIAGVRFYGDIIGLVGLIAKVSNCLLIKRALRRTTTTY